ncbi:hypothetical protein TanjilG_26654 [Lupinus angustifolius]|uniref:Uncharacterized protein n=1 Tax=Lupinus angustifolius TaxID=3871 RepID=A0A1J7H6L9_LUPAN|nr:hypothetical protein TanjilG_26654 [Lupinus angustifolius]
MVVVGDVYLKHIRIDCKKSDKKMDIKNLCSSERMESELVEKIAKDVLEKLNRVYVGDLDQQIAKYEQLAQLQKQYFETIPNLENCHNHRATVKRITDLKMERNIRMLRLSPDMLSHLENSNNNNHFGF